ncbi:xanthine dehydrogenase family protein subunit M [Mesorhizobium sediminum]|nr:xanthine dehydrogenase family protein subunit M [Mesorhizobium sediminum]
MRYAKPKSIDEALALLADGSWTLLAGGTDFYPTQGNRPVRDDVLDLNGLQQLRHISQTDSHFVFGARATWTDIIRADLPPAFDALKLAAREVGSIQIQNSGTIAGNLCNASPAADGVPPLLTLSAEVVLRSASGERVVGLADFILGNRRTARAPGELLTAVRVPRRPPPAIRISSSLARGAISSSRSPWRRPASSSTRQASCRMSCCRSAPVRPWRRGFRRSKNGCAKLVLRVMSPA